MKPPRKYPTGIQSFRDIIEGGYAYVDKTKFLLNLIDNNKSYFLSRPRRFGKSLTLSTFKSFFSGERTLFDGLAGAEWFSRPGYKKYPVILLDMSSVTIKFGAAKMNDYLVDVVKDSAGASNIQIESHDAMLAFSELIRNIRFNYEEKIVLLIDEYDRPILDSLDDPKKYLDAREILQQFYSRIKSNEDNIRFTFVTGISKLAKTGLSSTLNHLNDITYSENYSTLCGYTQGELLKYFLDDLTEYAKLQNKSLDDVITDVSNFYNGFSFDGKTKVYNPYSLLSFLDVKKFDNFWFDTATPTFLEKHLAKKDINVRDYIDYRIDRAEILNTRQIENTDTALFLLQTGYLTLKSNIDETAYLLDYPNVEVLASISRLAANNFFKDLDIARKSYGEITSALARCDIQSIVIEFSLVIDGCGYDTNAELEKVKDFRREFLYRDIIAIFLYGTYKVEVSREIFGASGRSDLLIKHAGKTFIIEVKVAYKKKDIENKLREGVSQAHSKRYANWNFFTTRTVEILVIVIDNSTRKIVKHKHFTVMKEDVLSSDIDAECGNAHPVHDE